MALASVVTGRWWGRRSIDVRWRLASGARLSTWIALSGIAGLPQIVQHTHRTHAPLQRSDMLDVPCVRRTVLLAIATSTASCSSCQLHYSWTSLGPREMSGAIREVIVDPANPKRLYAAAENGGIWVLPNVDVSGSTWRPLSDQLENLQMRGVAKSPTDSNYIVAANGLGFVYHTTNHGLSWQRVAEQNFLYVRRLVLSEGLTRIPAGNYTKLAKETRILVASRDGLYRIRLANNQLAGIDTLFPNAAGRPRDVLDVAVRPNSPNEIYVGVRNSGIWRSENEGSDWQLSADWATWGDTATPMIKLAISGSRIVGKMGRNMIANDSAGAPTAWRALAFPGHRKGDDGGSDIGYRGNYSGSRGEWTNAVAIHPTNRDIIAVGQSALFVTLDGGKKWKEVKAGHEDMQSLVYSADGNRLYLSNDGGVFSRQATDTSTAVTSLNRSLVTAQFYRVARSGRAAIGNADHQGIWGTRDVTAASPAWERATPSGNLFGNNGLENDFVSAEPSVPSRFYIVFGQRDLLRLTYPLAGSMQDLLPISSDIDPLRPFTNRSDTSAIYNRLNYPVGQLAFDVREGSNIILTAAHVVTNRSFAIMMTRDGQATPTGRRTDCGDTLDNTFCYDPPLAGIANWRRVYGPVATAIVSVAFSPTEARKVYALDDAGAVLHKADIDDDAAAWQIVGGFPVAAGDHARQIVPHLSTPGYLFALTHRRFFASTDGGVTWNSRGGTTLPNAQLNALVAHPTRSGLLYLGTSDGVYGTDNGGYTWKHILGVLPRAPVMQLLTDSTSLYAVTFGRGLWRAPLPR